MNTTDFTIITVNYNGLRVTCELLDSLQEITYTGRVIVVDNGSTANEAKDIKLLYPWVTILRSDQNLGFAGGNNLALALCTSGYIMLLNNDTVVKQKGFEALIIDFFESNPHCGALSPKICFEYAPQTIQYAGYTPLSRITMRNHEIGYRQPDLGQHDKPRQTPYAHGAALALRFETLKTAGPMDASYFLYYEELDWCERIRAASWQIWYIPTVKILHKESWSTGQNHGPLKSYYLTRNRLRFAARNLRSPEKELSILYQLLLSVPFSIVLNIFKGHWDVVRSKVKAINNTLFHENDVFINPPTKSSVR